MLLMETYQYPLRLASFHHGHVHCSDIHIQFPWSPNLFADTIWVLLAYSLAELGTFLLTATKSSHLRLSFSDLIGCRVAVMAVVTIFFAFSLGCRFARTINDLIAFWRLQGVGGSGLYALGLVLVVEISPPKMLAFISTLIGATIAIAGVLGGC